MRLNRIKQVMDKTVPPILTIPGIGYAAICGEVFRDHLNAEAELFLNAFLPCTAVMQSELCAFEAANCMNEIVQFANNLE